MQSLSRLIVNQSHPSARGLVTAWDALYPTTNLANSNSVFTRTGTNFSPAATTERTGFGNGALGGNYHQSANAGPTQVTEFTILGVVSSNSSSNQYLICMGPTAGGDGNWVIFGVSSNIISSDIWTSAYQNLGGGSPTLGNTKASVIATVNSVSQSRRENWINGSKAVSGTAYTTTASPANLKCVTIGGDSAAGSHGFQDTMNLILIWNRALSQPELASLTKDPWKLLFPMRRPIYLDSPNILGGLGRFFLTMT